MKRYIAIIGVRCPDTATDKLLSLPEVAEIVNLPPDRQIAEPIADHPDSLICIFDGVLYTHAKYAKIARSELSYICEKASLELCPVECERSCKYPLDCGFNALVLHDRHQLVGRKKSLAEPLKSLCTANTNQGYAGCTALYADGTVITADPSIKAASQALGIPVYSISGKDISLPGYNEGFIGGAGGYFDKTVCLFGSPEYSQSAREVEDFCRSNSLTLICLEDGPLTDRGGIKFIEIVQGSDFCPDRP